MGQNLDILSLPPPLGEEFFYICQHMVPFRLKYLAEIAAKTS